MCVICLSEENLDTVILCCYNMVHRSCLDNWLRVNNKCPVCRNEHIKELLQNISDQPRQPLPRQRQPRQRQPRQRPRQRQPSPSPQPLPIRRTTKTITIEINENGVIRRYTL